MSVPEFDPDVTAALVIGAAAVVLALLLAPTRTRWQKRHETKRERRQARKKADE